MATRFAWRRENVTAIARLGQRVGAEAKAHFTSDDFVDDRRIRPFIKVVYQLGALVAQVTSVGESRGSFHITNLVVIT